MGESEYKEPNDVFRAVWEPFPENYPASEFRLVYQGPLSAASQSNTRNPEKQAIRRALHVQLPRLLEAIPNLKMRTSDHTVLNPGGAEKIATSFVLWRVIR